MLKADGMQYHVALMRPMSVKLGGIPTPFTSFDATMVEQTPDIPERWEVSDRLRLLEFLTDCVYHEGRIAIRVTLYVPDHNIAGIIPQNFNAKGTKDK